MISQQTGEQINKGLFEQLMAGLESSTLKRTHYKKVSRLVSVILFIDIQGLMFSEEQIIEGCKRSETRFFEALYHRYAPRLMTIALRYANTTFEAEDILQEAFLKIFQTLPSYRYQGSFEGWLKKIVVRTAINHFHKHKKHFPMANPEYEGESESDVSSEEIIDHLSAEELIRVIQSLPEGYRLVFNLYEMEGYTHKEVAAMLGIEEGTSKSQLAKAKHVLKKLLGKFDYSSNERRK
jgi:RNA polymerase sigma factor (sigma-70 family)